VAPGGSDCWKSNPGESRSGVGKLMVVVARGGSRVDAGSAELQRKKAEGDGSSEAATMVEVARLARARKGTTTL
jgi:hypothetical protein